MKRKIIKQEVEGIVPYKTKVGVVVPINVATIESKVQEEVFMGNDLQDYADSNPGFKFTYRRSQEAAALLGIPPALSGYYEIPCDSIESREDIIARFFPNVKNASKTRGLASALCAYLFPLKRDEPNRNIEDEVIDELFKEPTVVHEIIHTLFRTFSNARSRKQNRLQKRYLSEVVAYSSLSFNIGGLPDIFFPKIKPNLDAFYFNMLCKRTGCPAEAIAVAAQYDTIKQYRNGMRELLDLSPFEKKVESAVAKGRPANRNVLYRRNTARRKRFASFLDRLIKKGLLPGFGFDDHYTRFFYSEGYLR